MTKMTQKNYEAIAIYRQKEKIFELKGQIQTLKQQLAIAVEALEYYENKDNYDTHHQVVNGNNEFDSNVMIDCGNKAEQALQQIKGV